MKIAKILSAAAAAVVAVSAVAVSASADFRAITDGAPYLLADGTGNYGICVYSDGDNKDGVPAINIDGLDLSAITHVAFTFDVIDATAAPGNKTTFLGDIMRNQYTPRIHLTHSGTVYAFDRDRKRYELLKDRCERYGSGNVRDPPRRET